MREKKSIFIEIPYEGDELDANERANFATWLAWNIDESSEFEDRDADTAEITVWKNLDDLLLDKKDEQD